MDGIKFGKLLSIASIIIASSSCSLSATAKIAAFGDSVTWGYGGLPGGWVLKLEGKSGIEINNLAVPGETSEQGAKRIKNALLTVPSVRTVIVMHGGNDWVRAFRTSPCDTHCTSDAVESKYENLGKNLLKIHSEITKSGRSVIFSTYWPSSSGACTQYTAKQFDMYQEHMHHLNQELIKAAKTTGSPIMRLDTLSEIAKRKENFFDCLHPNDSGYEIIANKWMINSDILGDI